MKRLAYLILILSLASCKKDNGKIPYFGYEYMPDNVGFYTDYKVTEIWHDDALAIHDTTHYYLREWNESEFQDNANRRSLRLERFKKDSLHHSWALTDIWYSVKLTERYEKVEEDARFIRLTFPVKTNRSWDGNAMNNQAEWKYKYTDAHVRRTIGTLSFDSTAFLVEHDFRPGFYFHEYSSAVYAKNIGLVERYQKLLEINVADTNNVKKGTEYYQTIIGYGVQ